MRVGFLFVFIVFAACSYAGQTYNRTLELMGTRFNITVVANSTAQANGFIDLAVEEISRIEKLISSWDPNSQTSQINRNAGIAAVVVDAELFQLIERALVISQITDGAFDITYAALDKIWRFDGSMTEMPAESEIQNSIEKVGFKHIVLDKAANSVFLQKKGSKIGFGAIGKGYAADKAKQLLMEKGVQSGIINASGDMNTWGKQPNGAPWTVAITNPMNKKTSYGLLPVIEKAVVTSGNYEKYVQFNGKRYAHIIDPRTGYPTTGILSVTIFAPKAEIADALATSVFVMGVDSGLDRINQLPDIECIIIDDLGNIHKSKNIEIEKRN